MPRHHRLELPGGIYHVIARGINRSDIFKDNADRDAFIHRFSACLTSVGSQCLAWSLMPNHFHLLIRAGSKPLSGLMRRLLTGYAVYFNRRHKRCGYLYQNRYKSILCQEDAYLLELVRYIHLNPVRGGVVKSLSALDAYPYAGHGVLVGNTVNGWQATADVLGHFGRTKREAQRRYRAFVEEGFSTEKREELTGGGLRRSAGGWDGVHELRRQKEYWRGDERVLGDGSFVESVLKQWDEKLNKQDELKRKGWNVERLMAYIGKLLSIDPNVILRRSRGTAISRARELVAYWGYNEVGVAGKELCGILGMSRPALTKSVRRGETYVQENNLKLIS